jgi:hypothetical protein
MAGFYRRDRAPAMFHFATQKIRRKNRLACAGNSGLMEEFCEANA